MVEFALILPLLLFLLMTIFEFGNIFHSYLLVTSASREGARMGVVGHTDAEITNRVQQICSTLNTSRLSVNVDPADSLNRNRGVALTVNVDYDVALITPLLNYVLPDPFPIKATSIMRIE